MWNIFISPMPARQTKIEMLNESLDAARSFPLQSDFVEPGGFVERGILQLSLERVKGIEPSS
jgi:hypothetical protein